MNSDEIRLIIDKDLEELVPDYVSSIISDLKSILHLIGEGDFETVRTLAHRMKGSGGGYGIQQITDKGLIMENAAIEKKSQLIEQTAESLIEYLQTIEIKYE